MRDHAAIEELIAARALDGLEPTDERELTAQRSDHGAGCEECLRLESAYGEVAGRLSFALEPAEVREGFEDELVERARSGADRSGSGREEPARIADRRAARKPGVITMPRRPAAAFAAAIVLLGGLAGYLLAPKEDSTAVAIERSIEGGARVVPLQGSGTGTLSVVFRLGTSDVFLVGSELPAPASGKTYELWMFHGKTPVSGGCFSPDGGSVVQQLHADLTGTNAMAVTVEPDSCPPAPTSQPVLSAPL